MISRIGIPIVLLVAWLAVFWAVLGGRQAFWYGDIGLYFAPLLHFQREALLTGYIPLWNPLVLKGTPFVGNPQAWPLYPSSSLLYLLSAERAVGVIGALHCLWAMLGTFLFLRRSGIGNWGGALGALTFGLSAAIVSKCQFPNMVQAASWLPWLLWALSVRAAVLPPPPPSTPPVGGTEVLEKGLVIDMPGSPVPAKPDKTGAGGAVHEFILPLIVALAILAAHPQMTWMQAILCTCYVIWLRPKRADIFRILGGVALGGLLAMGYLLPVIEVAMNSTRPELGLSAAARFFLPPYMILTGFVAPNFYGNPFTAPPYIGRGNYWEPSVYAGILPIVFALRPVLALFQRKAGQKKAQKREGQRRTSERFWGIVFLLSLWLAVGKAAGLYYLAYWLLPGTKTFHDPARFLHLTSFALAILAAYGFDALKLRDIGKLVILGIAAVDIALFVRTLNPTTPVESYTRARQILAKKITFKSNKFAWRRYVNYRAVNPTVSVVEFLSSGEPNTPMLAGRASVKGYEPVRLKSVSKAPPQPTAWRVGMFLTLLGAAGLAFLWHNRRRD